MFKPPKALLEMYDTFEIERNSLTISSVKGFFCSNNYPSTIQVYGNPDIQFGDYLVHTPTNRKYCVTEITPLSIGNQVDELLVKYISEHDRLTQQNSNISYNIQNINGSAIVGNQNQAILNQGLTNLDDLHKLISSKPTEDIEVLEKLLSRLEIITEDNQPISRGTLAKFSDVLAKHSDIAIAVGSFLTKWLIG